MLELIGLYPRTAMRETSGTASLVLHSHGHSGKTALPLPRLVPTSA
jgi:hypothetical protein